MATVTVSQPDGEIILHRNGSGIEEHFAVSDGKVTVDDEDVEHFLGAVPGSARFVEPEKPATRAQASAASSA